MLLPIEFTSRPISRESEEIKVCGDVTYINFGFSDEPMNFEDAKNSHHRFFIEFELFDDIIDFIDLFDNLPGEYKKFISSKRVNFAKSLINYKGGIPEELKDKISSDIRIDSYSFYRGLVNIGGHASEHIYEVFKILDRETIEEIFENEDCLYLSAFDDLIKHIIDEKLLLKFLKRNRSSSYDYENINPKLLSRDVLKELAKIDLMKNLNIITNALGDEAFDFIKECRKDLIRDSLL